MANQRATFSKRAREQNLKDKARAKEQRAETRRAAASQRTEKGPPMGEPQTFEDLPIPGAVGSPAPDPTD